RMMEKARSLISLGSTSIGGRGTEPAFGMGTLEKSGVPPGRTSGSGTWKRRASAITILLPRGNHGAVPRPLGPARAAPGILAPQFGRKRTQYPVFPACASARTLRHGPELEQEPAEAN